MKENFTIKTVPYANDSHAGVFIVYREGDHGQVPDPAMQIFRDRTGGVSGVVAKSFRDHEFLDKLTVFANENRSDTLEAFRDKLLHFVFSPGMQDKREKHVEPFLPVFTDTEYRILLAALAREKMICKHVDEGIHSPGIQPLVPLIQSIEKKIDRLQHPREKTQERGSLWT